ncbi:DoxX family protein [Flavimarina sp. Hel_I_48]|uniref:DoxX family protein n=1 Tax=Flavimarina sp. Hel_I_48 TaxID=1392488 RepID=UPI0004DF45D2|nr:DoxX family protein [Flavimarina sp. Hel_I_48]
MKKLSNDQLAFLLARITIGINLFIHGLIRIPKLSSFVAHVVEGFKGTYLPEVLVSGFAYTLPFIEFSIGLALILGLKTRFFAAAGAILIAVLIFGSGIKEDWMGVGSQMVYALFFFILLKNLEHNALALDSKQRKIIDGFKTQK